MLSELHFVILGGYLALGLEESLGKLEVFLLDLLDLALSHDEVERLRTEGDKGDRAVVVVLGRAHGCRRGQGLHGELHKLKMKGGTCLPLEISTSLSSNFLFPRLTSISRSKG